MADINLSPFTAEQAALERRRKLAEAMQQQAAQPIEMPTVPGAQVSHLQGLAKLLQGYVAGKNLEKADQEQKAYEANTMADFAKIYGMAGKNETVPGAVISPAVPAQPIQENVDRKAQLARLLQPAPEFAAQAAIGRNLMRPEDVQTIQNLPQQTEAVPEVRAPDQQVPMLRPEAMADPNFMKTGTGRMMLAQALMQQQAQQQALEQKRLESQLQVHSVGPGTTLYQGGKALYTNPKESPVREVKTIDANGMPITKYIPENVLMAMGNIPDQYKGFAADLIAATNLPKNIASNPQFLDLVGASLNKAAGKVTEQDVANYMLKVAETRAKLGYEGIPFTEPAGISAAPNPLVRPVQKTTTKAEIAEVAKKTGKTVEQVTSDAIAKGYKVE